MFSGEVRRLLVQVISSWQVIAVTVVLVIYISIVKYAAKTDLRRPRLPSIPKIKLKKPKPLVPSEPDKPDSEE